MSGGIALGRIIEMSPNYPSIVKVDNQTFLRNGYSTDIENVNENIRYLTDLGFIQRTSNSTGALSDVVGFGDVFVSVGSNGNIVRSANKGVTWSKQTSNTTQDFKAVAEMEGTLLAVGSSETARLSTNGGATWATESIGFAGSPELLEVHASSDVWLVSSADGETKRRVAGGAWGTVPTLTGTVVAAFSDDGNGTFVAISNNKIMVSNDYGETFVEKTTPAFGVPYGIDFGEGVFIALQSDAAVVRSFDFGETWDLGGTAPTVSTDAGILKINGAWLSSSSTTRAINRSVDDGDTWETIVISAASTNIGALAVSNGVIVANNNDNITTSDNAGMFSFGDLGDSIKYMRID